MKKLFSILILCTFVFSSFVVEAGTSKKESIGSFWTKFKTAVMKNDKQTLSDMVKYPLSMPYGVRSVKTKADFINRYKEIFDGQLKGFPVNTAKKCFANAKPEKEEGSSRYFVACNDVVLFYFTSTKGVWKLSGVDNINE